MYKRVLFIVSTYSFAVAFLDLPVTDFLAAFFAAAFFVAAFLTTFFVSVGAASPGLALSAFLRDVFGDGPF